MVNFELKLSHEPWGIVLEGTVEFAEEIRCLLFAWNGNEVAWAKSSQLEKSVDLSLCYYPSPIGRAQLITRVGSGWSTELMLKPHQRPTSGTSCSAEPNQVSILYRTEDHGVGLVALLPECTQSRRKKLWHIRPERVSDALQLFVQAYGRAGTFTGHPFAPAKLP
jgi:hypothetical protein